MGALHGKRRKQWDYYGARTGDIIKNEQHATTFYSASSGSGGNVTVYTAPTNKRARILRWKVRTGTAGTISIGSRQWIYDSTQSSGETTYQDAVIIQPGESLVISSTVGFGASTDYEFHIAEEDAGGGYLQ